MIEIRINKDIGNYEPKVISFLNKRQVICCGIALPFCFYFYFGTTGFLSRDVAGFLAFVPAILAGMFGWMNPYGLPMEQFVKVVFHDTVLAPASRIYITQNRHEKALGMLAAAAPAGKQPKKQKYKVSREAVR